MRRRDTILIAVFVNIGLLLTLFITAMPNDEEEAVVPSSSLRVTGLEKPLASKVPILSIQGDEVDQVLSRWNAEGEKEKEAAPAVVLNYPSKPSETVATAPVPTPDPVLKPITSSRDSTKQDGELVVTVKKGDSLDKISKAHGTTVEELKKLNGLTGTQLKIGQVLKVPAKKTAEKTAEKSVKKEEKAPEKGVAVDKSVKKEEAQYYTLKNGDSPWKVANKNQLNLDELLRLNGLDEEKAKKLQPGDKIRIK